MSIINPVHTPCKDCVYAKYSGTTQVDCHLGFIDIYKSSGVEIIDAYDLEKEFYVINDKKCIGYREEKWFIKHNMRDSSIDEKIQYFHANNFIKYLLVVNLQAFDNNPDLQPLQDSLLSLSIKPQKIIFVRHSNNTNYPYETLLSLLEHTQFNGKWRIQTVLDPEYTFRNSIHDAISFNKKYRFIASVDSSNPKDLDNIVSSANNMIYKNLGRFIVLRNADKSINLFSAPNYRQSLVINDKNILDMDETHSII